MTQAPARVSNWNLPNALTILRILVVPLLGWLIVARDGTDPAWRWWATALFVAAIATDRIDGDIARRRGLVTDLGKVLDPIADKAVTGMAFVGLSMIEEIPWWITVVILVREWGITLMRFWVIRHGVMPAGRGGKLKTALQSVALSLFLAPLWTLPVASTVVTGISWVVLIVTLVVTLATGVDYVLKAFTLRRTSARAAMKRARSAGPTPPGG